MEKGMSTSTNPIDSSLLKYLEVWACAVYDIMPGLGAPVWKGRINREVLEDLIVKFELECSNINTQGVRCFTPKATEPGDKPPYEVRVEVGGITNVHTT